MTGRYDSIFTRLASHEWITPFLENAMLADQWPDSYDVKIDSSEYYGKGDGYFHPSTHPSMGARQLYYLFHPEHKKEVIYGKRSLDSQMTLAMGSALHGVVQTQMKMAGLVKEEDIEVEYVNHEHNVRGRIDFIFNHPNGDRIPVELKTQNSRAFNIQEEPKKSWESQLSLALDNSGYNMGVVLVLESGFPYRFKEFSVRRNDELLTEIYSRFDYVRECIELNTPPAHCCGLGSATMKACPARMACWMKEE